MASRIAKSPLELPEAVNAEFKDNVVTIKGPKGEQALDLHPKVSFKMEDNVILLSPANEDEVAITGTMRALLGNMVTGVTEGFQKKLQLVGVGYRAQVQGSTLNLNLGFSHPVKFEIPEGIKIQTPSQTEIVIEGIDKQLVGQVAADIRRFRPPEPYKGKGVRYADEHINLKETKKK
jgi:large subunit ribosomal protein L6